MERNMAWAQHRRGYSLGSAALRDKDEDLALFKDMGKRDKSPFLRTEVQLLDHTTLSTKFGGLSHPQSAPPAERRGIGAELLNSDADKTDYDWLMTPPGTPLFPSLDADAPLLQHGTLINRSLAAIKTSRPASAAPRSRSPASSVSRGNPSPSRRPGTPQRSQVPAKQATSASRPATPTPPSRASPQPRPSTPTRQLSRPVTPLSARPATPTRRSPTPATTSSSTRPSTPTLRRSTSSPTGSRTGGSHIRNPSPTRSTASTATSVATSRGFSPARPARGPSPARGASPAPSSRGRSPSPSLRAPYPVDASDDIPPNLRTSSDRPSSAQRRAVAYGASPGEGHHPLRRTPSPARSVTSSVTRVERVSRASSDSESSFDTCSQSGVSAYGLVTPERRRMLGHGTGVDYGRSSSLSHKGRRGGSTTSPQLAPSMSKKSFESAAREYHRGQVAAFRPLMTNSSISTFYSSRASGLLRRPLTPSSTCSSSEHGATVAHDSDEDAGSITQWNSATKTSSGAHSPLHLFNKSIHEASSLDANDELSSFFRTPEALHVECRPVPVVSDCKVEDLESPEFVSELNWLNSRNAHELDREYLKDFDGAASPIIKKDNKHGSPGLEKIRDKLRHLKSTVAESHEDTDVASRAALETSIGDHEVTTPVEHQLQGASCEICGHRKRGCQCMGTPTSTSQAQEGPSSSSTAESARTDPDAANTAYAKERDIWYIYRHSSEYEVPVAGFSETKMEIDPPQILAKEVHMRPSPSSVTSSPPTVYIGKREHASRNVQQKENVTAENASAAPCAYRRVPETGNVNAGGGLRGAEYDPGVSAIDVERKGREHGATTTTVSSMPQLQTLQPERAANSQGKQSAQTCSSRDNVGSDSTQHSQHLSAGTPCVITGSQSFEGEKKRALGSSEGTGQVELWRDRTIDGGEDAAPVHSNRDLAEEQRSVSSRLVAEEARKQVQAAVCASVEAQGSEDHVSVIPHVKKIIWQEEDLQQFGIPTEAEERERKEMELRWEDGKVEDAYFAAECPPHGSVETQRPVAHTHGPTGGKLKTSRADDSLSNCFEPLELVGQKYLLTGEVHIDSALCGAAHFSVDSLLIKVQSSDGQVLAVDNPARLISKPQNEINAYAVYEYSHWAEVGARLTLSAHYGRVGENSSSEIVFCPREHQVLVIADEKQPRIPEFQGRPGVHAKETVVPVLDGSEIPAQNEVLTGGLKSRDMEVTCSDGVAVPLYDTSAGIHPSSGQRHPEQLLKALDAKAAQPKPEVPAAKTGVPEFVQDENVASHSLDLPQEVVDTHNAAASSSDELTSTTGEHFHYMLGSKSGRRRAEIPSYAIVKPISLHGVDQSSHSSERLRKEKTPPRNQSREIATKGTPRTDAELAGAVQDTTAKSTSRADAELAGGVSQSRDTTTKPTILADVELPVGMNQRRDTPSKYTSRADAELAVGGETTIKCTDSELPDAGSQSRDTTPKCSPRADSKLADGGSQGRETPTKSPCRADLGPRAKVTVEAPVKEEIVESADSPSPGTTRKHMSSFKFSHKKMTGPLELKRSNTTFSSSSTAKFATQPAMSGSKRTSNNNSSNSNSNSSNSNSAPVIGKPASPQLNKGRSVRAPSPSRPPANARAAAAAVAAAPLVAGAYGEVPPEEPSIHSRFSNITVRSGSDTEIFDWGPSSLEETGSRCGSSSGPNAASMAVLSPRASRTQEDMIANGDHVDHDDGDGEDDDEFEMTSPSPQSSGVVIYRNGLQSRRPSNASPERLESSAGHPPYLSDRVRLHHGPSSTGRNHYPNNGNNHLDSSNNGGDNNAGNNGSSSNNIINNNNNYAPKQNLDKLSEKLEQLETFGARVLLRNPQQQFLRSPPSHGTSKPSFVGSHPSHSLAGSCRSSRSLGSVRVDVGGPKSAAAAAPWSNKCRCAIL